MVEIALAGSLFLPLKNGAIGPLQGLVAKPKGDNVLESFFNFF